MQRRTQKILIGKSSLDEKLINSVGRFKEVAGEQQEKKKERGMNGANVFLYNFIYFCFLFFVTERVELTFCISATRHQIVETAMIATYDIRFARCIWSNQIPNKCFNFLITFVNGQAIQQLKYDDFFFKLLIL